MHSGFRGNRVGLRKLTIQGSILIYEIAFVDEDGVVHGTTEHRIPAEADSDIKTKVDALADVLLKRAANIHFTTPSGASSAGELKTQGDGHGGISAVLADPGTKIDDDDGPQG